MFPLEVPRSQAVSWNFLFSLHWWWHRLKRHFEVKLLKKNRAEVVALRYLRGHSLGRGFCLLCNKHHLRWHMERNVSVQSVETEEKFANHCLLGVSCLTCLYHDLPTCKRRTLPAFFTLPVNFSGPWVKSPKKSAKSFLTIYPLITIFLFPRWKNDGIAWLFPFLTSEKERHRSKCWFCTYIDNPSQSPGFLLP